MKNTIRLLLLMMNLSIAFSLTAQEGILSEEVEEAMIRSTEFMVEEASMRGGYLWYYLPDFSRQWGEMEAYPTMIWIQHPGTISMGHLFLDAFRDTGEEYYYGNSTFDGDVSSDAARFLLRIYLEKLDPGYKPALDKALNFILESQYPLGGWPQRYPLKYDYNKDGRSDYSSYYTFNDDVTWENIHFLIQCYLTLGGERLLDPIRRGMEFYLLSQHESGAWAQQYDMDLNPAWARSYEPKALQPSTTYENSMLLLEFYQITGDRKFLDIVPAAIAWLEETTLPVEKTQNGRYTHANFIEVGTNRPLYVHREGSNVMYGRYYVDYEDNSPLSHYGAKTRISLDKLKQEYARLNKLSLEELTEDSPLAVEAHASELPPQRYYNLNRVDFDNVPDQERVEEILNTLDEQGRWLITGGMTSNPYIGKYIVNMKLLINYLESQK